MPVIRFPAIGAENQSDELLPEQYQVIYMELSETKDGRSQMVTGR